MTRALAAADATDDWTPAARALRRRTRFVFDGGGSLRADADGWSAFAADLLLPLEALVADRDRIHACANPQCRLVFLDASKSGTRRWCDDGGCGNRHRVRRYRGAHR
jgi:predicted RNA-binding Zn ribbon-like protein